MNLIQISIILGAYISIALSYQFEKNQNDINSGPLAYFNGILEPESPKNIQYNEKYNQVTTNHDQLPEVATEPEEDNVCVEESPQKPEIQIQNIRDKMLRELKEKADQYLKNIFRKKK